MGAVTVRPDAVTRASVALDREEWPAIRVIAREDQFGRRGIGPALVEFGFDCARDGDPRQVVVDPRDQAG
jgi:hypothetical protein